MCDNPQMRPRISLSPVAARTQKCFLRERNAERRATAASMRERLRAMLDVHDAQCVRLRTRVEHLRGSERLH